MAVVESDRLHKQRKLDGFSVEGVHDGLWYVGVHQILGGFPRPIEPTRAGGSSAAHTPLHGLKSTEVRATAEELVAGELERNAPVRVGGRETLACKDGIQRGQHRSGGIRPVVHRDEVLPKALHGSSRKADGHHGPVSRVVGAVAEHRVVPVPIAVVVGAGGVAANHGRPVVQGPLQLDFTSTVLQVHPGRDEGSRVVNDLHRQGGVPGAAEVVGDDVAKFKRPGVGEHQVHVVSVVADLHHAQICRRQNVVQIAHRVPVGRVSLQSNHRGERGHTRNNFWVEVDAPFVERAVVGRPLVDDVERPNPVERASHEVAQVATRQVRAGRHGAGGVGVVRIVKHPLRVHVPRVVVALDIDDPEVVASQILGGAPSRVGSSGSSVVHQQDFRAVRTRDPKAQVADEAVLDVGRDELDVVAILEHLVGVKEVDEQLRGKGHPCCIWQVRQFRHSHRRQGRPGDALHRVSIQEPWGILAKRGRNLRVENGDGGHQHLVRQQVGAVAVVHVLHHEGHDVLPGLAVAVSQLKPVRGRCGLHRAVAPVPNQAVHREFRRTRNRTTRVERHGLVRANPHADGVVGERRRADQRNARLRVTARGHAAHFSHPSHVTASGVVVHVQGERHTPRGVVDAGSDADTHKRVARACPYQIRVRVGAIEGVQHVVVVGVGVGLEVKRQEIHLHRVARFAGTKRDGEVVVGVRVLKVGGPAVVVHEINRLACVAINHDLTFVRNRNDDAFLRAEPSGQGQQKGQPKHALQTS